MEIGKAHALVMEAVDIGGFEHGIAVTRHVAVALIICEDEDDVRAATRQRRLCDQCDRPADRAAHYSEPTQD
jgi:hypothetical protein